MVAICILEDNITSDYCFNIIIIYVFIILPNKFVDFVFSFRNISFFLWLKFL